VGLRHIAFVIVAQDTAFDVAALPAHCAVRIVNDKVPAHVRIIRALPVTPGTSATKIQKHKLREQDEAQLADGSSRN